MPQETQGGLDKKNGVQRQGTRIMNDRKPCLVHTMTSTDCQGEGKVNGEEQLTGVLHEGLSFSVSH